MNQPTYEIAFCYRPFCKNPKHVLIILQKNNQFVLTRHCIRGLEFPGGKVEPNEPPQQAAIREVLEETGCTVKEIQEIGQYRIPSVAKDFVKSIFVAEVLEVNRSHTFLETEGVYFFDTLTEEILMQPNFSFIMQDGVVRDILEYLSP